jgi:hypothetical protein
MPRQTLRRLIVCTVAALLLASAPVAQALPVSPRSTGARVAAPNEAPWAVYLRVVVGNATGECSGTLIAADRVLTAAHCMSLQGTAVAASAVTVAAGWTGNTSGWPDLSGATFSQQRNASSIAVHPYYDASAYPPSPDDVAVVTLTSPLDTSHADVQAIPVGSGGSGGTFNFYGYGIPTAGGETDGNLRLVAQPASRDGCSAMTNGGYLNALLLCGSAPGAQLCPGDSGGGLVTRTAPTTLVAVASTTQGDCVPGNPTAFANISAPEIARWLSGEAAPPKAPRFARASIAQYARTLRCVADDISGSPTLSYAFSEESDNSMLQDGPSTDYVTTRAQVGHRIRCVITGSNAGGTGSIYAGTLSVWDVPDVTPPVPVKTKATLGFRRAANGIYEYNKALYDDGLDGFDVTFTDSRGHLVVDVAFANGDRVVQPKLAAGKYVVCLRAPETDRFEQTTACINDTINGKASALVHRGEAHRQGAHWVITLRSDAPAVGEHATLVWSWSSCARCNAGRTVRRRVTLKKRLTLQSPSVPRGRYLRVAVAIPSITVGGVRYSTGRTPVWNLGRRPSR